MENRESLENASAPNPGSSAPAITATASNALKVADTTVKTCRPFVLQVMVFAHPLYISVTEINHNASDKTLEVSCKIFADDFEKALTAAANKKVDLFNPKDKNEVDKLITDYIKKHLGIKLDGKAVSFSLVGFEREEDAIWSYFQVTGISTAPKKIEIMDNILYEVYDKEINLVHASVGGNRKSTKLDAPEANAVIEF